MKVVYVSSLEAGGPVSHLLTLAPSLARLGLNVRVVCASEILVEGFRTAGVEACAVPMRHKLDVAAVARLWPLLNGADIVHTHDRRAGLLARVTARARGARVVHTVHGVPEEIAACVGRPDASRPPGVSRARAALQRHGSLRLEIALARLGFVVTPSHAMARFLAQSGLAPDRLRVIPHAIDVRRTEPRARGGVLVLGAVGRLEYWKGFDILLAACARVTHPLRLEIFGDGSLREQLEARAAESGVQARFHGHVRDVRPHLDDIDVFVLPSRAENLPVSILEAMASAVPVISTRVGGVAELVEDGCTGLLVGAEDIDGLARAIDTLVSCPELAATMGRAGAQRARQHFDDATLAPRMAGLYEEIWRGAAPTVAVRRDFDHASRR